MGYVLFKKRKSNAEYDRWAAMFPATDDCVQMQKVLMDAQNRYAKEKLEFTQTRPIKIKEKAKQKMERDTLGQYIADLKSYIKDLQCGVGTLPQSTTANNSMIPLTNERITLNDHGIQPVNNNLGANPPVTNQQAKTSTAPDAQTKSNTLLYVGIGAAVLLIGVVYFLSKKD